MIRLQSVVFLGVLVFNAAHYPRHATVIPVGMSPRYSGSQDRESGCKLSVRSRTLFEVHGQTRVHESIPHRITGTDKSVG